MDLRKCQIVLQDDRVLHDRQVTSASELGPRTGIVQAVGHGLKSPEQDNTLSENIRGLLQVFESVHVVKTGSSCMATVSKLDTTTSHDHPIFVIIPVASDLPIPRKGVSRVSFDLDPIQQGVVLKDSAAGVHGLDLIQHIAQDKHYSKLVVPIALSLDQPTLSSEAVIRLLEAGAREILTSVSEQRLSALTVIATATYVEGKKTRPAFLALKKQRKISWVGMQEDKPYAHLRETMVSKLMQSICQPQTDVVVEASIAEPYRIPDARISFIKNALGNWEFPAHDLNYDELAEAAVLMLKHALTMPELDRWKMNDDEIRRFMLDCRAAYNDFVLYHNFRHIVDVLQAVFSFLIAVGALPKYPYEDGKKNEVSSPIATLLKPFDAFVLLITAIGHDVGHPGVNNAFLVSIKAPLAQLYNDNSVLEAFHCAAYSQILRRYWPKVYEDVKIRQLLIKSILATDMQLHFKYMTDLGNLQEKLAHNKGIDGWNDKILDDYRNLACGLLIKCADISNLARPFKIAEKWTDILQLEFARQGEMEQTIGIETTLFGGPPELGNVTKLANSQIGFMNIFALPLFESVTDVFPPMKFTVNQIKANQEVWKQRIEEEKSNPIASASKSEEETKDGWQSPRSASPDTTTFGAETMSHPEGLPASGSKPSPPDSPPMNTSQGIPDSPPPGLPNGIALNGTTARSASAPANTSSIRNFSSPTSLAFRNELNGIGRSEENVAPDHQELPRGLTHAISTEELSGVLVQARSSNGNWPHAGGKTIDPEAPVAVRMSQGNFSRPMSQRHSNTTRSSAPSAVPSTFNPQSPTGTQATSLYERESESDISTDDKRPSSAYSTGMRGGSGHENGYDSYGHGTNGYIPQQPTLYYSKHTKNHNDNAANTRSTVDKTLKTKRSRSRFFPPSWFSKKSKSVESVSPTEPAR